ncbi:MAG TPA: hypothetical protein VM597_21175 [Gemmataceae bacterium]|nr:hypothetical protein [Gemmataceae bacterium]
MPSNRPPSPTLPKHRGFRDLSYRTFGLLKVRSFAGMRRSGARRRPYWRCRCACGRVKRVRADDLLRGHTRSCGPCGAGGARAHGHRAGGWASPTYVSWQCMVQRCYDARHSSYTRYGARGITVCRRWRNSFAAFLADMGERPGLNHTLDRIDGRKGYTPANTRWATRLEQSRNLSSNRLIRFRGKVRCRSAWADAYGLSPTTVANRLAGGWSVGRALTTPARKPKAVKSGMKSKRPKARATTAREGATSRTTPAAGA